MLTAQLLFSSTFPMKRSAAWVDVGKFQDWTDSQINLLISYAQLPHIFHFMMRLAAVLQNGKCCIVFTKRLIHFICCFGLNDQDWWRKNAYKHIQKNWKHWKKMTVSSSFCFCNKWTRRRICSQQVLNLLVLVYLLLLFSTIDQINYWLASEYLLDLCLNLNVSLFCGSW